MDPQSAKTALALMCAGCADGQYGFNCSKTCGHCKTNTVCDKSTGRCPSGCQADYYSQFCNASECSMTLS